jgi:hypothetical protein
MPRRTGAKYASKRLRSSPRKRVIRSYAKGGLVTRTGLARVHAGEYVTNAAAPHPFKTAIINPFVAKDVRIPDDTALETFCVTQTANSTLSILPVTGNQLTPVGMRFRPSMADGYGVTDPIGSSVRGDSYNLCYRYTDSTGAEKGTYWNSANTTNATGGIVPPPQQVTTYIWGLKTGSPLYSGTLALMDSTTSLPVSPFNVVIGQNSSVLPQPIAGPMGYALQQGSKCRPVAWGIRVRYGGLTNTVTTINPYGRIYFGINTPNSEGDFPGGVDTDTHPVYDGQLQASGQKAGGPGFPIVFDKLRNDATLNKIGCLTLDQLRDLPNGIVIGTGPRTPDERLFRDVDYYAGQDRVYDSEARTDLKVALVGAGGVPGPLDISQNQLNTLQCNQPWFVVEGGINVVLSVDYIIHWEVSPTTEAYTLPGMLRAETANTAIMDSVSNLASAVLREPTNAAIHAASIGEF